MKRMALCFFVILMLLCTSTALAAHAGDTVTVKFTIDENPRQAVSARVAFRFPSDIFEFVYADKLSPQVLNNAPESAADMFGLVSLEGLSVGEFGSVTLRIRKDAPLGDYPVEPVVDSVYTRDGKAVTITISGETITVEHTYDEGVVTTAPGCLTSGVKTFTCLYCSASRTESIPAKGHAPVVDKAVAATCTAPGKTEGKHCSVCSAVLTAQKEIPAKGHSPAVDKAVAPTCTAPGKTEGKHCSVCSAVLTAQKEIPAKGHSPVVDKAVAATCTAPGKTEGKHCSVCSAVLTAQKEIPAKGHAPVVDKAVAATCTAPGKTEGKHCSVCNVVLTAQIEIPAKGHAWDAGKVTLEPTATEDGVLTYTCASCGATRTEAIPATGVIRTPGDADEDGLVSIFDALTILQYDVGWDVSINVSNADVNADDYANIFDALLILQYDVGWDVELL